MAKVTQELKYKRLKVGHACYICRSKKIKCDGLRPCMQCKARGRNCEASNIEPRETPGNSSPASDGTHDNESNRSNADSDDDSVLFSRSKQLSEDPQSEHNYEQKWTSTLAEEKKDTLGKFPTFGSFVRWRKEPPLPSKYSCNIEMPPSHIQMHLIDLFFQIRYEFLPVIPKRMFYDQLRVKGPLITPLLLNAMYCSVSGLSTLPNVPKPSVFYNRAKSLLDDFLDTPRVSTVVSLCFLSLYEPAPIKTKTMADQHCRSWIYSGMGFRMCLELGLNIDSVHSRGDMSIEDIELRRRLHHRRFFEQFLEIFDIHSI